MLNRDEFPPKISAYLLQKKLRVIGYKAILLLCIYITFVFLLFLFVWIACHIINIENTDAFELSLFLLFIPFYIAFTIIGRIACSFISLTYNISTKHNFYKKISKISDFISKTFPFLGLITIFSAKIIVKKEINFSDYLFAISMATMGLSTLFIVEKYFSNKQFTTLYELSSDRKVIFQCTMFPKTWNKTRDSFLDTIEAFPDELNKWERRNLKYVAYLVITWDFLGFSRYFLKTLISNMIATRRVSS